MRLMIGFVHEMSMRLNRKGSEKKGLKIVWGTP